MTPGRPWVRWVLTTLVVLATAAGLWAGHLRQRAERAGRAGQPGPAAPAEPGAAQGTARSGGLLSRLQAGPGAGDLGPAEPDLVGAGAVGYNPEEPAGLPATAEAAGGESPAASIWVHVAGSVARPGVYQLPPGARVADAVAAAGGPAPEGVADALNLAARLADGDKVYVPSRAELAAKDPAPAAWGATHAPAPPGTGGATAGGDQGAGARSPATGARGLVNVNRADAAELERVPGIGPVLAQRIVEFRRQQGPFGRLEDLLAVPGIGEKKLAELRKHLTV